MTAKIYRLDEYRLRRYPTGASHRPSEPGAALGTALRAVAANPSKDFKVNASVFQRAFREAIERTNAQLRGQSQAEGCEEDDGGL